MGGELGERSLVSITPATVAVVRHKVVTEGVRGGKLRRGSEQERGRAWMEELVKASKPLRDDFHCKAR